MREIMMARKYTSVFFFSMLKDTPGVIWEARLGLHHSHYVRGELFVFK